MDIVSVNVARPIECALDETVVLTSIGKRPTRGPVPIHTLGLEGDGRAEPRKFGESHHAVSVLATEHYEFWSHSLDREFSHGCFGENLTIRGALESVVRIGDIWACGSARVQVAQPRIPCRKWQHQLGLASSQPIITNRRVGFYLRVLEAGEVCAGAPLEVLESDESSPTVDEFFRLTQLDYWDADGLERLLGARDLMPAWATLVADKLARARTTKGWLGSRPLELVSRTPDADDPSMLRVALRCAAGRVLPTFEPGQFLAFAIRGEGTRARTQRQLFLLRAIDDGGYEVAVRTPSAADAGADPIAALLADGLALGATIRATAPRGLCTLEHVPAQTRRLVVVCAQSGAAPTLALLEHALATRASLVGRVLYVTDGAREPAFARALGELVSRFPSRFSLERIGTHELASRIGEGDAGTGMGMGTGTGTGTGTGDALFAFGPTPMLDVVRAALAHAGFDASRLVAERAS